MEDIPIIELDAEEVCDGDTYSEIDRQLCDLDCKILNNCNLGIVPKTISIEDAELCIG